MINDIRQLLQNEPTINVLVGTNVFVTKANTGSTMPRIVLHQMGSDECHDLEKTGDSRIVEIDVDCEGDSAQDAYGVAAAVREFIQDYTGATVAGGIVIDSVKMDDEHEKKAEKTTQYAVTVPIEVLYRP